MIVYDRWVITQEVNIYLVIGNFAGYNSFAINNLTILDNSRRRHLDYSSTSDLRKLGLILNLVLFLDHLPAT